MRENIKVMRSRKLRSSKNCPGLSIWQVEGRMRKDLGVEEKKNGRKRKMQGCAYPEAGVEIESVSASDN